MSDRPLTEREHEILSFLLTAPGIPDVDILRQQAAVATGVGCECGCATVGLNVDPSAAPQASPDIRRDLVETTTDDIARVHRAQPLRFFGDDGETVDPQRTPTAGDLEGYIGLILWTTGDGWLDSIEMQLVGNFERPATFPPAEVFDAPSVSPGPRAWNPYTDEP